MAKLLERVSGTWARTRETLLEHAYLVTLGAAVAVIAATAMYTSRVRAPEEAGAWSVGWTCGCNLLEVSLYGGVWNMAQGM